MAGRAGGGGRPAHIVSRDAAAVRRPLKKGEYEIRFATRQAELPGEPGTVLEDFLLALGITDAQAQLALGGRDLADQRHPASDELQQVMVHGIDHGAQEREGSGNVGHNRTAGIPQVSWSAMILVPVRAVLHRPQTTPHTNVWRGKPGGRSAFLIPAD